MDVIRYLGLSPDLSSRVQEYFDYLAQYSHPGRSHGACACRPLAAAARLPPLSIRLFFSAGPDGLGYLSELPSSMFHDITVNLYFQRLKQVPLFRDCEDSFIEALVLKLRHAIFTPSEVRLSDPVRNRLPCPLQWIDPGPLQVVFKYGDVGHEMFMIEKGTVAVINASGETIAILREGGFFGELALLATARRSANVTTLTHSDLVMLTAYDLQASEGASQIPRGSFSAVDRPFTWAALCWRPLAGSASADDDEGLPGVGPEDPRGRPGPAGGPAGPEGSGRGQAPGGGHACCP